MTTVPRDRSDPTRPSLTTNNGRRLGVMSTPLPEPLASVLRSDSTAALAALMVIANAHRDLLAWAARIIGAEPPVAALPNGDGTQRRETCLQKAKPPRAPRKPPGTAAYHARRREARGSGDQALLEALRANPEGSIGDWSATIHKGRSSTVSALKRLRDAGLAESAEGKRKLTEEPPPREPPARWIQPVSAAREHRAHA
jgi:hypothetical protein